MPARAHPAHLKKRVGAYYLGRTIGEGTYAKVKYGQHVETGEAVAIKVLDKEHLLRTGMVEQVKREITILKQIRHPHVVALLEVMSSRDKIYMVMELVTGGELFDRVVAEGPIKEGAARMLFCQLLDALGHCHSQGVFHRDLKPENVLLASSGQVKLSDFGLGTLPDADRGSLLNTTCGTPNYVAPEVLQKGSYRGGPADIWSLGVVLYVMLTGCLPFEEDDLPTLYAKIKRAEYSLPPWVSPEAAALLQRMLDPDASTRATIEETWSSPWVRGYSAQRNQAPLPPRSPRSQAVLEAERSAVAEQMFARDAEVEEAASLASSSQDAPLSPGRRRSMNAFQLISSSLNISAMFEQRKDVVTRFTRFSTRARPGVLAAALEHAAVALGGHVERRSEGRLRLMVSNSQGVLRVAVELFEVSDGRFIVDVQKVSGSSAHFYRWYDDLQQALGSLMARRLASDSSGSLGSSSSTGESSISPLPPAGGAPAAAPSTPEPALPAADQGPHRRQQQTPRPRRPSAFELLNSAFSIGALFEAEHSPGATRHVQFSSRQSPEVVLAALEAAVVGLGGSMQREPKGARLVVPLPGGRSMPVAVRLFEILQGVQVCQLTKEGGPNPEFFRFYGQLATACQPIMMKKRSHPHATHAAAIPAGITSRGDGRRGAGAGPSSPLSFSSLDDAVPLPSPEQQSEATGHPSSSSVAAAGEASAAVEQLLLGELPGLAAVATQQQQ